MLDIDKTTRINHLFDFYQALLTPKQCSYMEMYYLEDYSLGEISTLANVSRQAVYDNIRRTGAMLETYESKLHLFERFEQRCQLINDLEKSVIDDQPKTLTTKLLNQLKELD